MGPRKQDGRKHSAAWKLPGRPLEEHANTLGTRFEENRDEPFSVAQEIATWIAEARY